MIFLNKWRVKEALENQGLSITALCGQLNITTSTIYRWFENGFSGGNARKIAFLLDVPLHKLQAKI